MPFTLTVGLAVEWTGSVGCYRERMARVDDVVAFVLEQSGTMTTYKLQKLEYYAQGWSLAWDDRPLFDAKIKAYGGRDRGDRPRLASAVGIVCLPADLLPRDGARQKRRGSSTARIAW